MIKSCPRAWVRSSLFVLRMVLRLLRSVTVVCETTVGKLDERQNPQY